VVISSQRGADLHMAQMMPLPLTVSFSKIQIGLPFWYWLTRVVPEKGPLNGCVCVWCVCVCVRVRGVCVCGTNNGRMYAVCTLSGSSGLNRLGNDLW